MDMQVIIDRIDDLDEHMKERMNIFENSMNQQTKMCRELCSNRLLHIEESVGRAHFRLNGYKKIIDCLMQYKNRFIGAIGVIAFVIGIIGLKLLDII